MTELEAINVRVSQHAIDRYRERLGASSQSTFKVAHNLRLMLKDSTEHRLKPKFSVVELLDHNFKKARYYRHGKWMLVVGDNTILTLHKGTADRWEPIKP